MRVIGLTGGVACGKSTVAKSLAEKGFPVIDTDVIAHDLIEKDRSVREEVRKVFGTLERAELRKIIFEHPIKRKKLEQILHPAIGKVVEKKLDGLPESANSAIVIVPLLYETGWDKKVDEVIAVLSDREIQRSRLLQRDGITADLADRMINAQLPNLEKENRATYVLHNNGSREELEQSIGQLYKKIS